VLFTVLFSLTLVIVVAWSLVLMFFIFHLLSFLNVWLICDFCYSQMFHIGRVVVVVGLLHCLAAYCKRWQPKFCGMLLLVLCAAWAHIFVLDIWIFWYIVTLSVGCQYQCRWLCGKTASEVTCYMLHWLYEAWCRSDVQQCIRCPDDTWISVWILY